MQTKCDITGKAMLVNFKVSLWTAAKQDKNLSNESADLHKADRTLIRTTRSLLEKSALEEVRKVASRARTDHYQYTLPWLDDGSRILSAPGFLKYAEIMRAHQDKFDQAVNEFVRQYPDLVDDARRRLNGLFNPAEYPDVSDMKQRFGIGFNLLPFPDARDFRVDLNQADVELIRRNIEASTQAAIAEANRDIWNRAAIVVSHMVEKLRGYVVTTEGISHPFRDTLVTNIEELVNLIPLLNITEDAEIARLATTMQAELTRNSAETLRLSDTTRAQVADTAEQILAHIEAYI